MGLNPLGHPATPLQEIVLGKESKGRICSDD